MQYILNLHYILHTLFFDDTLWLGISTISFEKICHEFVSKWYCMYFGGRLDVNKALNQIAMNFIMTKPNFENKVYQRIPKKVQKLKSDYIYVNHDKHD